MATQRPRVDGTAYEVLGASPDADARALKARYHQIAKVWHPDVSTQKDAATVFPHVSRAYGILTNPQQRMVYDFVLANGLPITGLDRFEAFYSRARNVDLFVQRRHRIGWAAAAMLAAAAGGMRLAALKRRRPVEGTLPAPPGVAPGAVLTPAPTPAPVAPAVGGLLGGASAAGSVLAVGASGMVGARWAGLAAIGGALLGRGLLPSLEERVGRMRILHTRTAHATVAYGRPMCELAAACGALLLLTRAHPSMRIVEAHLRAARAALCGGLVGHGIGRVACRSPEVAAATAAGGGEPGGEAWSSAAVPH